MTLKRVAIVGGGPAAMFAAQACHDEGIPEIHCYTYVKGRPAVGSFWFHDLPPSIAKAFSKEPILVYPEGTPEGYHRKQYGPSVPMAVSSFPLNVGVPLLKQGYNPYGPWKAMEKSITDYRFGALTPDAIERLGKSYDLVFSTVPRKEDNDRFPPVPLFPSVQLPGDFDRTPNAVWSNFLRVNAIGETWIQGKMHRFRNQFPGKEVGLVFYSGEGKHPWVRMNFLHGRITVEYPIGFKLDNHFKANFPVVMQKTLTPEHSPLTGDELFQDNIYLIGRFATWDRHLLSHQVYSAVCGILSDNTTKG